MLVPRVQPGDVISADLFNALVDAVQAAQLEVAPGSGLVYEDGPGGRALGLSLPRFLWGKTTGALSGGTYPFTQQREDASGAWINGPVTGTAYEVNGNTSVAVGTRIKLWRTAAGDWRFLAGAC